MAPYDGWVAPDGVTAAEFRRHQGGYHLRFADQADIRIRLDPPRVTVVPAPGAAPGAIEALCHNAIAPLLGNHLGGLHLHGSAVVAPMGALAFLGLSRSGKTTLAGAFARAGHPFLSEDVLALAPVPGGYLIAPQRPVLRLFADSAAYLAGAAAAAVLGEHKGELAADAATLPAATAPAPLHALFLLGPGTAGQVAIRPLAPAAALAQLLRHAFVLDVEDKPRLAAHFGRLAALAATVSCHVLDYPRQYAALPGVIAAVLAASRNKDACHALD